MRRRALGTTGIEISEISLGGAGAGGLYGEVPWEAGVGTIVRAVELGVNYVEAAPFYGRFEAMVADALSRLGPDAGSLHLCTKVGMHPERHGDYSAATARWSIEQSLRTMGVDRVDIAQVHAIDAIDLDAVLAPDGALAELERLRDEGRVGAIGFAIRGARYHRSAMRSGRFDLLLLHDDLSLIRRTDRALVEEAAGEGLGVLVGRALMTGLLAGEDPLEDPRLATHPDARTAHGWWRWARDRGVPLQAVALQFVLRQPGVTSAVVGASSPEEIGQDVAAATMDLPEGLWDEVEERLVQLEAASG